MIYYKLVKITINALNLAEIIINIKLKYYDLFNLIVPN